MEERSAGNGTDDADAVRRRLIDTLLSCFDAAVPRGDADFAPWPVATAPISRTSFESLAREIAAYQVAHNSAYARYAARSGAGDPSSWASAFDAPPLPTSAFKRTRIACFDEEATTAVFRSSGTTERDRGRHHFRTLELTQRAALGPFVSWMMPDHAGDIGADSDHAGSAHGGLRMLVLMASHDAQPDSSLGFMLDSLRRRCGAPGSGHFVDPREGLDVAGLRAAFNSAVDDDVPVFLLGPSSAYVHMLEAMPDLGVQLPRGSRIFETGGFKGRTREFTRASLHEALVARLGVPAALIAGEYGMSELSSQLYEPSIRHRLAGIEHSLRLYVPPPWCAVRVVDPNTLEPVPVGDVGQIAIFDLANLDSVAHILTGDIGRMVPRAELPPDVPAPGDHWRGLPDRALGLELHGRAADATPKGCSIAMDAMLSHAALPQRGEPQ